MALPSDTQPEARRVQLDALRSLTPAQRVQLAIEMSELAARLSAAGAGRRGTPPPAG